MLRIGSMNMLLHGVENPDIRYRDSLAQDHAEDADRYPLVLANPPFAGALDAETVAKDLTRIVKTRKTELLFLALVGLYSPVAAVSSYLPVLQPFAPRQQLRIALGLFGNVAGIAIVTVLIGEPLLHILGLTTAALSATGGISLMIAAVPLMTGRAAPPAEQAASDTLGEESAAAGEASPAAEAVSRRVSDRVRVLLDRVAGILLVGIAATLLASGFTRLVIDVLHSVKIL